MLSGEKLKPLVGNYQSPAASFTVTEKGGHLWTRPGTYFELQYLTPLSENEFLNRSRYDHITFIRNEQGAVTGATAWGPGTGGREKQLTFTKTS
jgi:hypothetical protein